MAQMHEMHEMQGAQQAVAPERGNKIRKMTNLLGAAISVGLVVGIGIWGYRQIVRDVSGVPVVRAAEGPMRVLPDDPGGSQAAHQGLSVNVVAAGGAAADPADRLVLAPAPLELSLDDEPAVEVTSLAAAAEVLPADDEAGGELLQLTSVEALVATLTEGVTPLQDLTPAAALATAKFETPKIRGGLGRSLRPQLRPVSLVTASASAATADISAPAENAGIDAASIPVGTRLAQLGAYESAEIARAEWDRLSNEFSEYLDGKERVIQRATSGGRSFYRLRAMGFDDLNDARRFCSALIAERAECIPVVTR